MANFNINKSILGGRLTADVELKQTPNGVSVCQFTIAVNRKTGKDKEPQTDFINCVAWRQTAEFISRYFRKGSSLCVVGNIQTRTWTDQNNQKRYSTEVVADEISFVDSKGENSASVGTNTSAPVSSASTYVPDAYKASSGTQTQFELVEQDEGLPF